MLTLVLQSAGFEKANKVYRIIRLPTPTVHKMKTARNLDHLLRFTQWSLFPCSEAHLHPLLLISKGIFILYFILPLMRRKQLEYLFRVVFYILDGFPERTLFQKDERRVEGIEGDAGHEERASTTRDDEHALEHLHPGPTARTCSTDTREPVLKRTQRKRRVTTETDALYPPHDRQLVYIFMQKSVGGVISARFEVFEVDNIFSISSL